VKKCENFSNRRGTVFYKGPRQKMVPGDSLEPPESEKIGMHGAAVTKSPLQQSQRTKSQTLTGCNSRNNFSIFLIRPDSNSGRSRDHSLKFSEISEEISEFFAHKFCASFLTNNF